MSTQLPEDWTEERKQAWHERQAALDALRLFDEQSRERDRQREDERKTLEAAYIEASNKLMEVVSG